MEQTLCQLIDFLKEKMPSLSVIDEDYGQLENIEDEDTDMYPLTFPAVLIEEAQTEWSDIGMLAQKGTCRLRIRLIIDCYDDTHATSGTTQAVRERNEMRHQLHQLLQGTCLGTDAPLIRKSSKFFTWKHGIKVYEMMYECTVSEKVKETRMVQKPSLRVKMGVKV